MNHVTTPSTASDPVAVSEVRGEGPDAHRLLWVAGWTFRLPGESGTEPMISDREHAAKLGLPLKKLRQLSGRHEAAGSNGEVPNIAPVFGTPVVPNTPRDRGRVGISRFYSEADALFLVTRSETAKAIAVTKEMIRVYCLARRGLLPAACALPPAAPPALDPALIARVIAEALGAVEDRLRDTLRAELRAEFASQSGALLGTRGALAEVLYPLRALSRRAAKADPLFAYGQHCGRFHVALRDALGIRMHLGWAELPANRLAEVRSRIGSWARDLAEREGRLTEIARRENKAAQTALPFRSKN